MTAAIAAAGALVALGAAVRSTWSPCGLSMLSTITPLGESGRGRSYRTTATWFVVGAAAGGACLGAVMAGLAAVVRDAGPLARSPGALGATALVACTVAVSSDTRILGVQLPVHHRQVNERWLDEFRPWVYGAGFGWQIGTGVATYVMTAGVYLLVVLGALSADPALALILGCAFGTLRGLAVLLGRAIHDPGELRRFHRRFASWEPASRRVVVGAEALATATLALHWGLGGSGPGPWLTAVAFAAVGLAVLVTLGVALVVVPYRLAGSEPA
jgi:hypothetical protein